MSATTPERWARIKALFQSALPLDSTERAAHLDAGCQDDPELRREVESLLASHDESHEFLETTALATVATMSEEAFRKRIGPYRILEEIGRGGMGTVYLAERIDGEFRKRVAIKLISRGMDSDAIVHRFRHERQILADLDHPHIARLLDGGATEDGRPYFVMEHVEGVPVDAYCESTDPTVERRLELFCTIGSAVEYAHRHLIVHRDLKPGNILVDAEGTPKLLDFGIAKVVDPGLTADDTVLTIASLQAMTPQYASPEQIRGESITTASDVYSLGVLLHRLLVGRPPYPVEGLSPIEVTRLVCEHEPARPSAMVADEKLRRRLRGDIDTIVGKALQKDPARRYPSVQLLVDDIRRHLDGRPVQARPDRLGYRARKFVTRHRIPVAAAALLLVSLVGGIAATTWQMRVARDERARAERRFDDVRDLARKIVFEYNDAIYDLPGSTPVRERLVRDAFSYLESLDREAGDDPSLRREVGEGFYKIGEVQARLGDLRGSLASHRRSRDILAALAADDSRDVELLRSLAASHQMVADRLTDTGGAVGALESHLEALEIRRRVRSLDPAHLGSWLDVLDSQLFVGRSQLSLGEYDAALASLGRAVEIGDSLLAAHPLDQQIQFDAMTAWYTLASGQLVVDDLDGSAANYLRAREAIEVLRASDTVHAGYRQALSRTLVRIGRVRLLQDRPSDAVRSFDEALAITGRLAVEDPANAETRLDLATIHGARGEALAALDRPAEATEAFQTSLHLAEAEVRADPAHIRARRVLAATLRGEGELWIGRGRPESGIDPLHRSLSAYTRLLQSDPVNVELGHDVATLHGRVGLAHERAGLLNPAGNTHREAACRSYERSQREWDDLRRREVLTPAGRRTHAAATDAALRCASRPPPTSAVRGRSFRPPDG